MPSAGEILAVLGRAANELIWLAVLWHAVIAAAIVAAVAGWRPEARRFAVLPIGLAASVSICSSLYGNPFNGAVFAVLALLLGWVATSSSHRGAIEPGPFWAIVVGALLVAFGWLYPHFLSGRPAVWYLVAAPVGVVPCPTLAVLLGLTLLGFAPVSRLWTLSLAAIGALYAVIGVFRLHVGIDAVLLAGVLGALVFTARPGGVRRLPGRPLRHPATP